MENVTNGFKLFLNETNGVGQAFMDAIIKLSEESCLDKKVHELSYISVLVTAKMFGGLPFHIEQAKRLGATKEEIRSAILLPMPIIGLNVAEALPYLSDDED